jgi:uncharacterized membrane protein YkoI
MCCKSKLSKRGSDNLDYFLTFEVYSTLINLNQPEVHLMKISPKMLAVSAAIGIVSLAGLGSLAYANQGRSVAAPLQSVKLAEVSDGDGETIDDAQDKQESAKFQSLAKITAPQAQQAAEANSGGRASSVKLENEDGNLLYAVTIGQKEVMVDAGNGRVLYTEAINGKDDQTKHPNSGIRVADQGDGDGETNDDRK